MSITSTSPRAARFGKIPTAEQYSGRSRSRLYQLAAIHHGLFVKDGKSTLVNLDVLDEIMGALPPARIGEGK